MTESNYWKSVGSRRLSRRGALRGAGVGLAGLAGAAIIGCGDDDEAPPAGATTAPAATQAAAAATTAPAATQAAAAEGAPEYGGTITTSTANEPRNISVWYEPSSNVANATSPVYSKLVRWASGPHVEPLSVLEGDAAASWEVKDPTTWVFTLRDNVKFHPKPPLNGRALDSEDVKTSLDRMLVLNPARGIIEDTVESYETPDDKTIIFHLNFPYTSFSEVLTGTLLLYLFSKEANAGDIDDQQIDGAIGTGPWMWKSRNPSISVEWEAHPEWHIKDQMGGKLPYAAGIKTVIIPEYAQSLAQFAAGNLSFFQPATEDAPDLLDRADDPQIRAVPVSTSISYFAMNQNTSENPDTPMVDERLRRAWSMALDRFELLEVMGQFDLARTMGFELEGGIANMPVPYGIHKRFWYLDPFGTDIGDSGQWYKFNPSEAKKLVDASGYDGREIKVGTPSPSWLRTLEPSIPMLTGVGLNAVINVMEYSEYVQGPYAGKGGYDVAYGNMTSWPTIDETAYNLMMPDGARNMPRITESTPGAPPLFDMIRAQRAEADTEARLEIFHNMQRLTSDRQWWVMSINGLWGRLEFAQSNFRNFGTHQEGSGGVFGERYPYQWFAT